jgi:hypothetical protein
MEKRRGCYIFGIRAAQGFTPGYVGKARKKFEQETFAHHKLTRYQQFLVDYQKGTPIIFFVVAPKNHGKPNIKRIEQLEVFLENAAANDDLLNIRGTKAEKWSIAGVLRSKGKGKPSKRASQLKQMLKLKS